MAGNFEFSFIESVEGIIIVKISGELTELHGETLKDFILKNINKDKNTFILNLRDLDYINSSGLGVLAGLLKTARKKKGDIALSQVPKVIKNILDIAKLNRVFEFYTTDEEALQSLKISDNKNVY